MQTQQWSTLSRLQMRAPAPRESRTHFLLPCLAMVSSVTAHSLPLVGEAHRHGRGCVTLVTTQRSSFSVFGISRIKRQQNRSVHHVHAHGDRSGCERAQSLPPTLKNYLSSGVDCDGRELHTCGRPTMWCVRRHVRQRATRGRRWGVGRAGTGRHLIRLPPCYHNIYLPGDNPDNSVARCLPGGS